MIEATNQPKPAINQKSKRTPWIVSGVVVLVLIILGGLGFLVKKKLQATTKPTVTPQPTQKIREAVNVIHLAERPFISLKPKRDGHNIALVITTLPKPAQSVEYELEYQTGSMLQGAFGEIELSNLPQVETVFLGSCSAGGSCTYHEDLKGGSLLTRFQTNQEKYVLKSDFRWWERSRDSNQFASRDAKLKLVSDDLAKNSYVIIFNGAGLPDFDKLDGEVVSDIYVIGTSNGLKGVADTLTLRTKTPGATGIAYWTEVDGWQYFKTEQGSDAKEIEVANIPLAAVYVGVKR